MGEKLTSLAQLRMAAEKSKELSAQVAAAAAAKSYVSAILRTRWMPRFPERWGRSKRRWLLYRGAL